MIAHERALDRRERTVRNRETPPDVLREARRLLLAEEWSPKQISGWLKKKGVRISHERIYEMIRDDESGELKSHCRHRMKYRRRKKRRCPTVATNIPERVSIHERPAEADGRRFGDWEMDTIVGKGHGHDSRERAEKCDTDPVRAEQELPDNGEATARHGSREGRGCRHQACSIRTGRTC